MNDWNHKETHVLLWLLIAFCLGTLYTPTIELLEPIFTVDNR